MIEEQARRIVFGDGIAETLEEAKEEKRETQGDTLGTQFVQMRSKEAITLLIKEFVAQNGDISKVDLSRKKNNLPTITEIKKHWGGLKQMKTALGIRVGIQEWNQETIKARIEEWIHSHNDLVQIDLTSKNGLPSVPCVLRYYPKLRNFSEIKEFFGLVRTRQIWTKKKAIDAGQKFIETHGKRLRQHHLGTDFGLPSARVIEKLFGGLREYQGIIGADVHDKNVAITEKEISEAVQGFFGTNKRVVKNKTDFFNKFEFSISAVSNKYPGGASEFFEKHGITELEPKKYSYTKDEIDRLIVKFLEEGGSVPKQTRDLSKLGLPSADSIHKYYDSWREPFIFFSKMLEKIGKKSSA